jgi:hypothetical protein
LVYSSLKIAKRIGFLFLLFILFAVGVGFFLPDEYGMERSITINAPAEQIFPHVNNLKMWSGWSPWNAIDPNMKLVYSSETPVGEGAWYSWKSNNSRVGVGKSAIIESKANSLIRMDFNFGQNAEMKGSGKWTFESVEDGTKVTWGMSGVANNFGERYFGILMEQMVGGTFEEGLSNLKAVIEK